MSGARGAEVSAVEIAAMQRAVNLARQAVHTSPNPRVGCVLLDASGTATVAEGFHERAGQPHAEAMALARAGRGAEGATAVVTLEPCSHTGRTGPCAQALVDAGVRRVVIGRADPNPQARGGAEVLRAAGVEVVFLDEVPSACGAPDSQSSAAHGAAATGSRGGSVEGGDQARSERDADSGSDAPSVEALGRVRGDLKKLNRDWETALRAQRPVVILKVAGTLDGRVAAADGTSRWITGAEARAQVHRMRAAVDAVMVGTGTALTDDPQLGVRSDGYAGPQPLRVVVGARSLPEGARVLDDSAETLRIADRDPAAVLAQLWSREVRTVLLEGGPTLAAAFLSAGLVDRITWYVAPMILGAGRSALADLGITTIGDAQRWHIHRQETVGADLRIDLSPAGSDDVAATGPRNRFAAGSRWEEV